MTASEAAVGPPAKLQLLTERPPIDDGAEIALRMLSGAPSASKLITPHAMQ
jgi:hypothetical protein